MPIVKPAHILLAFHLDTAYGRGVLSGIARYAREQPDRPFRMELVPMRHAARRIRHFEGHGIIANVCYKALAETLHEAGVPAVDVAEAYPAAPLPQVCTDNRAVGQLAATYLLGRGFRQFAYFGLTGFTFSDQRGEAFARGVRRAGCECAFYPPDVELRRRWLWEARRKHFEQWLRALPKPIGLMACMDHAARHLTDACLRAGLRVPEQVAILGVDNDEVECEMAGVPISSISLATRRIGHRGAELLAGLMQGEAPPGGPIRVPPVGVVTRRSSDVFAIEDAHIAAALRYIHEHIADGIKVSDLLTVLPISRRELERRFNRRLGHSPHAEIRRAQIDRARKLLAETDLPMSQVASASGLKESKRLSMVFRQQLGLSPTEFRRSFGGP